MRKTKMFMFLLFAFSASYALGIFAQAEPSCTLRLQIEDVIGVGTLDYLERGLSHSREKKCGSILLAINTPGGNLQTTRLIVEKILNSPVPVLCLVEPSGAHAGSAGAIILLACHLNGALEATNLGAATPILGSGENIPADLRKKMVNDTVAWLEGLAVLRGRDKTFARDIVTSAKAVTAAEAKKLGAIDALVSKEEEFLNWANGKEVSLSQGAKTTVQTGAVTPFEEDFRYRFLSLISDPEIVYLLFLGSLGLLYFEITHPGAVLPGVLGALGFILSLISFHKLQVEWGGLLLILLGVGFMIAEIFVTSFGLLGIGGVVSFVIGGLFLFDPATSGYSLPVRLVFVTGVSLGLAMLGLGYLALRTRNLKKHGGIEDFVGLTGKVFRLEKGNSSQGQIEVQGEIWKFESDQPVAEGDSVKIRHIKGLTAFVSPTASGSRKLETMD